LSYELIEGLHHIGIAVKSLEEAIDLYRDILGLGFEGTYVSQEQKVKAAFFSIGTDTRIELLEPTTSESSIARFLEKRGEGVHHIAFQVQNIEDTLNQLKKKGVELIDNEPRKGAHETKIAFIHPKSTRNVLIELVMK
jgi:methylmalonyl-CoA/ethylmalonyl-CoA epimerase